MALMNQPCGRAFSAVVAALTIFAVFGGATDASPRAQCGTILNRTVNVRDFGAVGDGAADDSSAFQSAADCLAELLQPDGDGRASAVLDLPAGRYRLKEPVVLTTSTAARRGDGLTVRGDGATATSIVAASQRGALQLRLTANRNWFNFFVTIKDIGFEAESAGAGSAIDIDALQSDRVPKITAAFQNLTIGGVSDDAYFNNGIKGAHMMLPVVENVRVRGPTDTQSVMSSCFFFSDTYGATIEDSRCTGAKVGVSIPNASEGEVIKHSEFSNVGIGIDMEVVPDRIPGPSSTDGKITGNYLEAREADIVLVGKSWFNISDNILLMPPDAFGERIILRDNQHVTIADNKLLGDTGAGITLQRGEARSRGSAGGTMITNNQFSALDTALQIGVGSSDTRVFGNHGLGRIDDHGRDTNVSANDLNDAFACQLEAWSAPSENGMEGILVWSARAASSGLIDHGVGTISGASGSKRVRVSEPVTFTEIIRNAAGEEASCRATLAPTPTPKPPGGGKTINVKMFGAHGDGVTDDAQAIERAVDAVVEAMNSGGIATLYFPAGTYRTSTSISIRQSSSAWIRLVILGDGPSVSVLVATGAAGLVDLNYSSRSSIEVADMKLVSATDNGGTAISATVAPGGEKIRSLVIRNLRINGDEASRTSSFTIGVRGIGLFDPLLWDVRIVGFYVGAAFNGIRPNGQGCVVLRGGHGLKMHDAYCTNMNNGFDITARGGNIEIWGGHSLAVVPGVGVRIDAGGGNVSIDSAHVNAGVWDFDISNAATASLTNTVTLNLDRSGAHPDRGALRVRNTQKVDVKKNMFNQSGPICPPPEGRPFLCYSDNPDRVTVFIADGVSEATISGNIFNEPGAAIRLPATIPSPASDTNLFLGSSRPTK